jgi:hypothetical protein
MKVTIDYRDHRHGFCTYGVILDLDGVVIYETEPLPYGCHNAAIDRAHTVADLIGYDIQDVRITGE